MTDTIDAAAPLSFEPPAPGFWELDTTHHGLRPLSPLIREAYVRGGQAGFVELARRYGLPLAGVEFKLVHGCGYMRPLGVGEKPGATPKAPPPTWLMKALVRLHPELRRRAKTAAQAFEQRFWRTEVDQWFLHDRAAQVASNLALQAVDPRRLDDAQLADHITATLVHFESGARRNLETHGGDLIPAGDLLAHAEAWGLTASEVGALLAGSSPATTETVEMLAPVARAIAAWRAAGETPPLRSVADVRAQGPDVAAAVDAWLEHHAWRIVTSDDVDRPTVAEVAAFQLAALLGATESLEVAEPDVAAVRARVPVDQQPLFDELVAEARYGHRQRDDIRGLCWNWPGGLVRRAVIEAGRRLQASGVLHDVEHVVELSPDELRRALIGVDRFPGADELAVRAADRDRVEAAPPPRSLGDPEPPPPLDALPPGMRRATAAMLAVLTADATPAPSSDEVVTGVGIGNAAHRGRACVVHDLMLAFDQLEPGDVLIASITGPAINSLMPSVGALVVEEGGPLCHAAIVSREFGLPAVIGAAGATTRIPHGAQVEVDPRNGTVRII